jgi:miniconductance mechanosensitive channel
MNSGFDFIALLAQTDAEVPVTETPSYASQLKTWFESFDLPDWMPGVLTSAILLLALIAVSAILFFIVRPLLLRIVKVAVSKTESTWDDEIRGHGVFSWASHFAPGLFILLASPALLSETPSLANVVTGFARIYLMIAGYMLFDSLVNFGLAVYRKTEASKEIPINAFVQVLKLIAALVVLILIVSSLIGQSPMTLLGGLGIFASVLILVFKDVILGLVAGIQIIFNRMISVGDWLEMTSRSADGSVLTIGLTTVKVQNWDKTITTIPTYALISESFKNWRAMSESGGRRIKRSIILETDSVRFIDEQLLARLSKIAILGDYLKSKENEIEEWNRNLGVELSNSPLVNGRRQTNIGAFRAYVLEYIKRSPDIHQEGMTLLVRQLTATEKGIPIEVYCFTKTTAWNDYEGIQGDLFDHFYAAAPEFDLHVFKAPSGRDYRIGFESMKAKPAAKKAAVKRAPAKKKTVKKSATRKS